MHMKKKQKIFTGISLLLLLAALLLGSGLAYALRPLHYRQDIYACTLDGENVLELKLDVTWNRHLWKPNEMHGKISIDGVEYFSYIDLHPDLPIKGADGGTQYFNIPADNIMEELDNDKLIIMPIGNSLDYFWFCFVRSGESYTYFCPARSQTEAQIVADLLNTR